MAKMNEVKPAEPRYNIEVSAEEKDVIAAALLAYRNINYYCDNGGDNKVRESFIGQTSRNGANLALGIIQAIRSE